MKKAALLAIFLLLLNGCKKESKSEENNIIEINQASKEDILADIPTVECYLFVQGKDSIELKIEIQDDEVMGSLAYKFFEKDNSTGSLKGDINGEILKADYTFKSEGTTSVREVIFLKDGKTYVPAYGEMTFKGDKEVFQQSTSLDFKYSQALKQVECE
ncbi:PH domain-containing protein [Galbibacter mesophilus]|uniref:hypothetical protein n=1 Tax=Galbibacter mesophilus TaxID=379069 RepID=UPI00191DC417|nr:hypothetical protein [Galbibacter mesophilus]MCM5663557.1 hypothetical protein [Galbibacter mesophilus]